MVYKVAVIGCGRIGVLFDEPGHPTILSHAHALITSPDCELIAAMDVERDRAETAAKRWNTKAYTSLEEVFNEARPDVYCICVPNQYHYDSLKQVSIYQPKAVVAEKPLTTDLQTTQEIVDTYRQKNIPLFVNYTRCYDPKMIEIRDRIRKGTHGRLIHAVVKYSKGIMHNGSHMIAAANFLFGRYHSGKPVSAIIDHREDDPTLSAVMRYEFCDPVFLTGCDERCYSVFEIDMLFEKGRMVFEDLGFRFRRYAVREDPLYPGDQDLVLEEHNETGMMHSLPLLWQQVVDTIQNQTPIHSGGELALETQRVCTDLLDQYVHETI